MIVVNKADGRIVSIGSLKGYWPNGYPIITDSAGHDCAWPPTFSELHDVEVPKGVVPEKYCYSTSRGFYENPVYAETNPYGISNELLETIKNDTIAEVEEAVLNGTDE